MSKDDEAGLRPIGSTGAQLKERLTEAQKGTAEQEGKKEEFDPGASMLGTDNEAGSAVDHDEMAQARRAPKP